MTSDDIFEAIFEIYGLDVLCDPSFKWMVERKASEVSDALTCTCHTQIYWDWPPWMYVTL